MMKVLVDPLFEKLTILSRLSSILAALRVTNNKMQTFLNLFIIVFKNVLWEDWIVCFWAIKA